jgi:hypothetical protein
MITQEPTREDIALWAQYSRGTCHGDWAPETEAIYAKVMQDDAAFEFYLRSYNQRGAKRV